MGIHTKFTGSTHTAIDLRSMADDMFAQVVADHAADRARSANRANRQMTGVDITYSVSVDGRVVHRGRGDILPEQPIRNALIVQRRHRHVVAFEWLWDKLQLATLGRAIAAYGEIKSLAGFARMLSSPGGELFRFLLLRYIRYRFPQHLALARDIDDAFGEIKSLYRGYRLVRGATGLIGGGDGSDADTDVLAWIAGELRARSPVVTGAYRDAHALYGDGRFIMAADEVQGNSVVPQAAEYSFTNTVPYSRKIEFGKTRDGRDFVLQVPNHIYERVAGDARNRFRDGAEIRYEMRAVIDAAQTPQRLARRPHNAPDVRFPSIVVRF